jgi:hypothetical protein
MFLDSLVGDAAWRARYALSRTGEPLPWDLHKAEVTATHPWAIIPMQQLPACIQVCAAPSTAGVGVDWTDDVGIMRGRYAVFSLRAMLSVPYFEKRLYELPEDQLTPANILKIADEVELQVQGGLASRPLLSVPHIISDEVRSWAFLLLPCSTCASCCAQIIRWRWFDNNWQQDLSGVQASCYYQGYVLAEMSVHQTRAHFLKSGPIVDNPAVGAALTEAYWRPGNSEMFLDLVKGLTGAPLTGDAWVSALEEDLETKLIEEKKDYDAAVSAVAGGGDKGEVDLSMRVMIKDGDELIADTEANGGFISACKIFEAYVQSRFAA